MKIFNDWYRYIVENWGDRHYTALVICITVFFLYADQNLLAPNLSAAADDFGFDENEKDKYLGAYISFGFFIVGAPAAIIVGYFTDTWERNKLFGLVVLFGEAANMGTYWVETYVQLLILRTLTGISIGGALPLIFSMFGDLFSEDERTYASTVVGVAFSAGVTGGQLFAGLIGPKYGWRMPFLLVSIPSIIMAGVMYFTVTEPERGAQEKVMQDIKEGKADGVGNAKGFEDDVNNDSVSKSSRGTKMPNKLSSSSSGVYSVELNSTAHNTETDTGPEKVEYEEKITLAKLKILFSTPTALLSYSQGIPGCLPWGMIFVYLNDYYSDYRGLSVADATVVVTVYSIGSLVGQLSGGVLGQILFNMQPKYQSMLMGGTTIAGVFPLIYMLNTTTFNAGFYIVTFIGGVISSVTGPNIRSMLQNVVSPEVRGCAFAAFSCTDDLGKGMGPALVYLFIVAFDGKRRAAFNTVVCFWFICGCLLLATTFTVEKDMERVQNDIRAAFIKNNKSLLYMPSDDDGEAIELSKVSPRNPLHKNN